MFSRSLFWSVWPVVLWVVVPDKQSGLVPSAHGLGRCCCSSRTSAIFCCDFEHQNLVHFRTSSHWQKKCCLFAFSGWLEERLMVRNVHFPAVLVYYLLLVNF